MTNWYCLTCGDSDSSQPPEYRKGHSCEKCGRNTVTYAYNRPDAPKERQKRKKKDDNHRYTYNVKWGKFKEIKTEADRMGCSINSLIDVAIDRLLYPPLIQTQSGFIPAQRPPAVGLPPSRKKGEKDPLVAEIESHPMFQKMKKRYG